MPTELTLLKITATIPIIVGAGIGAAIGAVTAACAGGSAREIAAAAVGGAVTGGMVTATCGASLGLQIAGSAMAGTAGYCAENLVAGKSGSAAGMAAAAASGATGAMVGATIDKTVTCITANIKTSPSVLANSQQGYGNYPGVDKYKNTTIKEGSVIYRGEPNGSGYFTNQNSIIKSGQNAKTLFEGLQVKPHDVYGYRSKMQGYKATIDIPAAQGKALQNPQYGAGGFKQYYVPNSEDLIKSGKLIPINSYDLN